MSLVKSAVQAQLKLPGIEPKSWLTRQKERAAPLARAASAIGAGLRERLKGPPKQQRLPGFSSPRIEAAKQRVETLKDRGTSLARSASEIARTRVIPGVFTGARKVTSGVKKKLKRSLAAADQGPLSRRYGLRSSSQGETAPISAARYATRGKVVSEGVIRRKSGKPGAERSSPDQRFLSRYQSTS